MWLKPHSPTFTYQKGSTSSLWICFSPRLSGTIKEDMIAFYSIFFLAHTFSELFRFIYKFTTTAKKNSTQCVVCVCVDEEERGSKYEIEWALEHLHFFHLASHS